MCICWCVTEINYKMHGAMIKVVHLMLKVAYSYNVAILRTVCLVSLHPFASY